MKINNKLLAKFEGRCWHEWEYAEYWKDGATGETFRKCKLCGEKIEHPPTSLNPFDVLNNDYAASPADRERLLQYLMGQEIWKVLESYAFHRVYKYQFVNDFGIVDVTEFIPWLFLPLPDTSIPRWLFLLQEWLGLEETVERFGVIDCKEGHPSCHKGLLPNCVPGKTINDVPQCTFKVFAPWARLVQDEKEG